MSLTVLDEHARVEQDELARHAQTIDNYALFQTQFLQPAFTIRITRNKEKDKDASQI